MKTSHRALTIGTVAALAAFLLGPVVWPVSDAYQVTTTQFSLFVVLAATTAVAFGVGMAFLFTAWPMFKTLSHRGAALATYLSIVWLLVSWWPHENLHRVIGDEMNGLLWIEYGFHVTAYIAGIIVALCVPKLLRTK